MLKIWDKLRGRAVPGGYLRYLPHLARDLDRIIVAIYRKIVDSAGPQAEWGLRALAECAPNPESRVGLGTEIDIFGRRRVRLDWRLSDLDIKSIKRAHSILDRALRRAGVGRLQLSLGDEDARWISAIEGGKHHMGTTRMHTDARHGVVDANARVHGIPNLYVTGSSVFPTPGFVNPTLTIVALALRLAEHLKNDLRSTVISVIRDGSD
jgi:choline dehydrogenase-like flavoprotein